MASAGSSGIRTFGEAVAVVTGGASGIGAALARELSRRGAMLILADRQGDLAKEVASAIAVEGGSAEAVELDVRDADAVEALVADAFRRFGRLDYLFNNAGLGVGGEAREYRLDDWRTVIEVNVMGVIHGVHSAYRRMTDQGFGHIVNTASVAGLMPAPFTTVYSASKHAVVGLSRSLRVEAATHGVRVSALCPGVIRTPILTGGRYGRITRPIPVERQLANWERLRPMEPDRFAEKTLDQVARNRAIIIVPGWWKAIWWLNRLSPWAGEKIGAAIFRESQKMMADIPPPPEDPSETAG
jgi:NAD(P)-dependent dehydrogenase (short-subunit alcohol dehydrogenase family)